MTDHYQVREIAFSGPTYQIEVVDAQENQSYWTFFQFDERAILKDAFCDCGQDGACPHLEAAHLAIYHEKSEPMHKRFHDSFWNALGKLLAVDLSYDKKRLQRHKKGHYIFQNTLKLNLYLENVELIEKNLKETPETSIKFSSLSEEEVRRWKEGRASAALLYELSFFADLAKYLFLLVERGEKYTLAFQEVDHFPTHLTLQFKEVKLDLALDLEGLLQLIPFLNTLDSPLKVYLGAEEKIKKITYDEERRVFHLHHAPVAEEKTPSLRYPIGPYWYLPGRGFYPQKQETWFASSTIEASKIPEFLDLYKEKLNAFFEGVALHKERYKLSYGAFFDKKWNLHLEAYLLKKGDLLQPTVTFFENYVYIPNQGFYPLEEPLYGEIERVISEKELSSFINHNRHFLNTLPGFSTHLAALPITPSYSVTYENALRFESRIEEESRELKDFGEWVYYRGEGFFTKIPSRLQQIFPEGMEVPEAEVGSFIRKYKKELDIIPNFFLATPPLTQRGLYIEVASATSIKVRPEYTPKEEKVIFFDEFVYLQQKGFFELPFSQRIPPEYRKERIFSGEALHHFLKFALPTLGSYVIYIDKRLQAPLKGHFKLHSLEKGEKGELRGELVYVSTQGEVSAIEIIQALEKKRKMFFSEAGLIHLHDEEFEWLKDKAYGTQGVTLSTLDFLKADARFHFTLEKDTPLLKELREFTTPQIPALEGFKSLLRVYQQKGLEWLCFLYKNSLSGLLCDDMGLGKTHQAMALMAAILNWEKGQKRLFLIVCPTSVIYHWEEKLAAFFPKLKVSLFHGARRRPSELPSQGVILTTYGILRVEKERLKDFAFDLAIFDEVQIAKNPHSKIHEALRMLDAKMRLGLTGTPIENSLNELKALFDIVLPGYMPSEKRFKEHFLNPIEKGGDTKKKHLLQRIVHPFVLRRKKAQVLQELPEKSVDKSYCDLSAEQKGFYTKVLEERKMALQKMLKDTSAPLPYLHIFSLLASLKMICNHPALFLKEPASYKKYPSGKWDLFVELLTEALGSEQKVVVFSQYLGMLDIMGLYLKEQGISFAEIRGETVKRKEELARFRDDPQCRVFLGSLNAAGLGIDLTAASVVILYDRWWNAAREEQAIDRVHRIGQKWNVLVFKLITKGTLEEKIDKMIEKKGKLLEEIVLSDDQAILKTFTREELLDLLTF